MRTGAGDADRGLINGGGGAGGRHGSGWQRRRRGRTGLLGVRSLRNQRQADNRRCPQKNFTHLSPPHRRKIRQCSSAPALGRKETLTPNTGANNLQTFPDYDHFNALAATSQMLLPRLGHITVAQMQQKSGSAPQSPPPQRRGAAPHQASRR